MSTFESNSKLKWKENVQEPAFSALRQVLESVANQNIPFGVGQLSRCRWVFGRKLFENVTVIILRPYYNFNLGFVWMELSESNSKDTKRNTILTDLKILGISVPAKMLNIHILKYPHLGRFMVLILCSRSFQMIKYK